MRRPFTLFDLQKSKCATLNQHLTAEVGKKKPVRRSSKALQWLELNLSYWAKEKGLTLEREYLFAPGRKYRSDWAVPDLKILIEYEGIFSEKSRHTSLIGYSGDADKYRLAAKLGFIVLRYTALNYKKVIEDLNELNK